MCVGKFVKNAGRKSVDRWPGGIFFPTNWLLNKRGQTELTHGKGEITRHGNSQQQLRLLQMLLLSNVYVGTVQVTISAHFNLSLFPRLDSSSFVS